MVIHLMAGRQEQPVINNEANNPEIEAPMVRRNVRIRHINADNDLRPFAQQNIQQMAQIGQPEGAPIINVQRVERNFIIRPINEENNFAPIAQENMQPMTQREQPQEEAQDDELDAQNDFDID